MIQMAVNGAAGRMGQRLVALAAADKSIHLVAALESVGHPQLGTDVGRLAGLQDLGLPITSRLTVTPEVLVDFSTPAACLARLEFCARAQINVVIGTTGFDAAQMEEVQAAAHQTAVLIAPNMSVGVNLLYELAAQAAKALGQDFDLEIIETHHHFKADAPSGTALALARTVCEATGRDFDETVTYGRHGRPGPRPKGQIGIHAVRAGDIVGEHVLLFGGDGERLEIRHIAHTRDAFARGALRAAKFLAHRPAGMYTMTDVLAEPVRDD
jgi:4-hydroxy-tetrahydrodipicolinate reductase